MYLLKRHLIYQDYQIIMIRICIERPTTLKDRIYDPITGLILRYGSFVDEEVVYITAGYVNVEAEVFRIFLQYSYRIRLLKVIASYKK